MDMKCECEAEWATFEECLVS